MADSSSSGNAVFLTNGDWTATLKPRRKQPTRETGFNENVNDRSLTFILPRLTAKDLSITVKIQELVKESADGGIDLQKPAIGQDRTCMYVNLDINKMQLRN